MTVTKIDPKKYKLSKTFCKDLEIILKVVDLSIRGLSPYAIYKPVNRILNVLKEEQTILKLHYESNKKLRDNKGVVN